MGLGLRTLQTLSITSERLFDIDGLELHLVHIHQITSSHIMGKLIRMSIGRRVPRQRELANKRLLGEGDRDDLEMEFCPFTFASAAELALAHLAFGSHAQNRGLPVIRDNQKTFVLAKKEVVICVGNAADAAGKVGQWALSKRFAKIAVDFCDSISRSEAKLIRFDVSSIKAKNQKRYTEASRQLN